MRRLRGAVAPSLSPLSLPACGGGLVVVAHRRAPTPDAAPSTRRRTRAATALAAPPPASSASAARRPPKARRPRPRRARPARVRRPAPHRRATGPRRAAARRRGGRGAALGRHRGHHRRRLARSCAANSVRPRRRRAALRAQRPGRLRRARATTPPSAATWAGGCRSPTTTTSEEALGFALPASTGRARSAAFVNSDGNLTFGARRRGDRRPLARPRCSSGPPRVAPFFADLDPSAGRRRLRERDRRRLHGDLVRRAGLRRHRQAHRAGEPPARRRRRGPHRLVDDAAGRGRRRCRPASTAPSPPVDLSAAAATRPSAGPAPWPSASRAERRARPRRPPSRPFYAEFADATTSSSSGPTRASIDAGTFAFETTVKNAIPASAQDAIDLAAQYGSAGRLASVVLMDDLGKYPADPNARANGENTSLVAGRPRDRPPLGRDAALPRRRAGAVRRVARPPARALELLLSTPTPRCSRATTSRTRAAASAPSTPSSATVPFDLYAMGLLPRPRCRPPSTSRARGDGPDRSRSRASPRRARACASPARGAT